MKTGGVVKKIVALKYVPPKGRKGDKTNDTTRPRAM